MTMEIMSMLCRWRSKAQDDDGHIMSHILIACDVYLLCILFCLVCDVLNVWQARSDDYPIVQCAMLYGLELGLQRHFASWSI